MVKVDSFSVFVDDYLLKVDFFTLHPEWDFLDNSPLIQNQHRTTGGIRHSYVWGKSFAWEVPLQFLSDSHADLINWWWLNQFNLAFTLDTSDSESIFITRITNEAQPIGQRIRSMEDRWQGNLRLESIHDGRLVF